ncbi:MAG: prepilin peptidase [Legionella sp.]|nr:MAG: prepilin peptidase [Legionella sp.]
MIAFSCYALLIGSVLSMVIYRLPMMLKQDEHTGETGTRPIFNLFLPRSHCTHCKKTIPFYHNIPLVSYLLLRGRCHFCQHPIAWQYPAIEALTLILSLCAVYKFGFHLDLIWVLPFIWLILCLGFIDLEHQLLPDNLTLTLLWLGLLVNTQTVFCSLPNAVWSAAGAYLSLWLLIKIFYMFTGKIGMGHGDFKLFAALGAWFGWMSLTPILLIACVLGTVIGLSYLGLTRQDRNTPMPFGPYLCIAGLCYLFFY